MSKKLIIGLSRPIAKKPFAQLIMWWDKWRFGATVPMSHGFAKFTSASWDRDFIYQAAGHQTHFLGGKHFTSINEIVEEYELEIDEETLNKIGRLCVDREGKPYAVKQVIGQIIANLVYLLTFCQVEMKNPFADEDRQVSCIEEMAVLIAQALGVEAPFSMDSSSVWPFRCWLLTLPKVRRVR